MQISRQQISRLGAAMRERFLRESFLHLREELPAFWADVPEDKAMLDLDQGCTAAMQAGFTQRDEILRYLEIRSFFRSDFGRLASDTRVFVLLKNPKIVDDWPARRDFVIAYRKLP
jgi:hypothetical protein